MNNNLLKRKAHVHKKCTRKQPLYWSQKFKKSTRLEEDKLGTKVTVQSKRALKKDDFS
jgi:hypothetical protein